MTLRHKLNLPAEVIHVDKNRAVPDGYMTVGQVAKRMQTTVRTLQYYDREGLLVPSATSEGGRRLYTDKDIVRLHQIQSLKYLGFSLDDIKNRLVTLDTPSEVADVLNEQAQKVRKQITALTDVLSAIEVLRTEIMQMDEVDFSKYADIIYMLQVKNDDYWVLKHFDDRMWGHIRSHFDEASGKRMVDTWNRICDETIILQEQGVTPDSVAGKTIASQWWQMIDEFTGGDMSLLPDLIEFGANTDNWGNDTWHNKWTQVQTFLEAALIAYFSELGINPIAEAVDGDSGSGVVGTIDAPDVATGSPNGIAANSLYDIATDDASNDEVSDTIANPGTASTTSTRGTDETSNDNKGANND